MFRFLALAAFLTLFFVPAATRAAPTAAPVLAKADGPTFILQVQSVEHLLDNAEYIAGLIGRDDDAKQWLGLARKMAGPKGIEGVDLKRPFLIYGYLNQELVNSDVVVMIPMADKDSFLGLLKKTLSLEVKEEKDGLFSTEAPNNIGTVYFRFANDYLYATYLKKDNVAATKIPKPADVMGKGDSVISIGVRIDRLPEEIKKFALGAIEENLSKGKDQAIPNETPKIKALKDKTIDSVAAGVKAILFEGEQITLNIDVDSKKDELSFDFDLTAKKGSALAKDFADYKARKSVAFGGLATRDAAMVMALNLSMPSSVKNILGPAIDDVVKLGIAMIPNQAQTVLEPLVKALMPTLKSGDLDGSFAFLGPNKGDKYTIVMVGKIAGGKDLEKAIKEIVAKNADTIPIQMFLELDADTIGDTKIHRLKMKDGLDESTKKIVGESDAWLAFRDDAFLLTFGPDAKDALKKALTSAPAAGPVMKMEFAIGQLIAALSAKEEKATKQAAQKVFGANPTGDTFAMSVDGGESLHVRIAVKGKVLQFFYELDKAKKGN